MDEMEFDYSKLRGKIREVCGTQDIYAEKIGLGRVSVSKRLNNSVEFTQMEMLRSTKVLGIEVIDIPAYFFTAKVQKHEQQSHC